MNRFLSFVVCLFIGVFAFSQEDSIQKVVFPEIMLKNVTTNFEVISFQEINEIQINQQNIKLSKVASNVYKGKIAISTSDIQIDDKESAIGQKPTVIPAWLSILPPLLAIALALIFKEVLSALFIGIFAGAAVMGFYVDGITGLFSGFLSVLDTYILSALTNYDHVAVILFSLVIGSIVSLISKNGGMRGVVNRLTKFAKTRKSGMLTTYFLGIAIFFDDYANTLVVGNTMRSVTDKLKVSREKLAYIVDSTAAPIAAIAFITTWIGAELTYISDGVNKIEIETGNVISEGAYSIFINSLAYSFYPIFSLFFVYFIIQKGKDFGPMLKAERRRLSTDKIKEVQNVDELAEFEPENENNTKAFNAIIPIFIVITGTFLGLIATGVSSLKSEIQGLSNTGSSFMDNLELLPEAPQTFFQKLGLIIGNADSYQALLWASLCGLTAAIIMTISQKILSLEKTMETVIFGIKTMIPAIAILALAWSLAEITEVMNTAGYLKAFFTEDFSAVWLLPAITFVLSAFIAFSTGSSWSTMALMYPLVIPLAYGLAADVSSFNEMSILYNTIASVLAGSVLGDHCSPISDTTILSSLATSCDHIAHVKTQLPYALTVGTVALTIGVIPAAFNISSFILFPVGILILYLIVRYFGKDVE